MKKYVKLFANVGGGTLSMEQAGFENIGVVELDLDACETLRVNKSHWKIFNENITKFSDQYLKEAFNIKKGDLDFLFGDFSCQTFSYAGKDLGFDNIKGKFISIY